MRSSSEHRRPRHETNENRPLEQRARQVRPRESESERHPPLRAVEAELPIDWGQYVQSRLHDFQQR